MGNTRQNKKRNRSSKSSMHDSMEKDSKKSKSVKDLLSQEPMQSPGDKKDKKDASSLSSPEVSVPKVKLNFDNIDSSPVPIDSDAPKWAKDLITSVQQLKSEIKKISALSEDTQKAINKVIDNNTSLTRNVNKLSEKVVHLEIEGNLLRSENSELKEKLLLLEFHQRRNNLVFTGIEESASSESGFDCYNKVMQCISNIPDLNLSSIRIDRCHRLGPKIPNRHRDIIAKFNWYGDLVDIMRGRQYLPDHIYVNEDYPEEWLDRRALLRPIYKSAVNRADFRYKVQMVRDKLIIDGKAYTVAPVNNLHKLPKEIIPSDSCERKDSNTIAFLGPHSVFSNFHQATLTDGGVKYNCAEQMVQAEKAALFHDKNSLEKIMKASNPYKIKSIGGRIRGFDRQIWKEKSKDVVFRAVKAKFTQNHLLARMLKSTGSLLLVEASPDKVWGTGVHLLNADCLKRDRWSSKGLMSEILDQVRSSIPA